MTALASALRATDKCVCIISAFEGLGNSGLARQSDPNLDGYELCRVSDPPSLVLAMMVGVNRLLRRLASGRNRALANKNEGAGLKVPSGESGPSLRSWVFAVLHLIDDKKRWAFRALRKMVSMTRPAVIIVSGPPMSTVLAATLAARALKCPVIVDLRDPICDECEHAALSDGVPVPWGRRALERYVVQHATRVITTSHTLRERLRSRYPPMKDRIECIRNGFDQVPKVKRAGTGNKLIVIYAGTLYLNRNPFPFFEALDWLLENPDVDPSSVEVLFVGDCKHYGGVALSDWLANRPSGRVVMIRGAVGAPELESLYERATLLLNFAEGQPMQVPAKTFELLALGREMLVLCEPTSDTAAVVKGIEGVSCVASGETVRLCELLRDIYVRHVQLGTLRAPNLAEIQQHSRSAQNAQFLSQIETTIRSVG